MRTYTLPALTSTCRQPKQEGCASAYDSHEVAMKRPLSGLFSIFKREKQTISATALLEASSGLFQTDVDSSRAFSSRTKTLTLADVHSRTWRLERANGDVVAKHLRLLPAGRMGGFRHRNEYRWDFVEGKVVFFDDAGQRTTVFTKSERDPLGRYTLEGNFLLPPFQSVVHVLREIEPLGVTPPASGAGVGLVGAPSGYRRNLVVLRANEASLHHDWPRDIPETDRSWDLCISWYGDQANLSLVSEREFLANQPQFRKFAAIHQLFFDGSPLWNYDFIMLPDDDLMLSWKDINQAFDLSREHRLELAQPSLREGSHWGLSFVLQQPNILLRFTSFVESMMPIFSREALAICLPTFPQSLIGWGLDIVWPVMLGTQRTNVAIFDAVSVLHTRPVGASYNGTEADKSGSNVVALYGITPNIVEYGRIQV